MITAQVNQQQLDDQLRSLRQLAAAVNDRGLVNRKIAIEFEQFVLRNFQTEGGMTEEGSWAELEEGTQEWKERRGYRMILQNEGELRDSFMPMYSRDYAGIGAQKLGPVAKSALKSAKESDRRYDRAKRKGKLKQDQKPVKIAMRPPDIAAVHEYGSGNVPARPMLPSLAQALAIGMRVYGLWLKDNLR